MSTCLVTGGSGFLGRHLLDRFSDGLFLGNEVVSVGRRISSSFLSIGSAQVDLDDRLAITRLVDTYQPSLIFHLAGQTPPASTSDYYRSNTMPTLHLLDTLREASRPCRVVLVGSAAELGPVALTDLPVSEDYPCRPAEPYGLSKWLATVSGLASRPPIDVVVARVFNPIGPGLPGSQALGRFARELAESSGRIHLKVGFLDARRDFVDVRDVAGALLALAELGQPGMVYHVGTGQSQRVGDGLTRLIELSGREVTIDLDSSLTRSPGPLDSRADIRRITQQTGWSPQITWDQSLQDLWTDVLARTHPGLGLA